MVQFFANNSSGIIKRGSGIIRVSVTGLYTTMDTPYKTTPVLEDIENKYDNRFDDPSYYYGGGSGVDGGDVGDVLGV